MRDLHVVAVGGQQPRPGRLFEDEPGGRAAVEFPARHTALGVLDALAQRDEPHEQPPRGLLPAVVQSAVQLLGGLGERALEAGHDLVIDAIGDNNTRHVVIFEKWNDAAHRSYTAYTAYTAYEQRSVHGTSHRSVTYGLAAGSE